MIYRHKKSRTKKDEDSPEYRRDHGHHFRREDEESAEPKMNNFDQSCKLLFGC